MEASSGERWKPTASSSTALGWKTNVATTAGSSACRGLPDDVTFLVRWSATADQLSNAFWAACHGGQVRAAEFLLNHEAPLNWLPGGGRLTPHDAAARSAATDMITWLDGHDARTANDLRGG